jgi:hypothetical protein
MLPISKAKGEFPAGALKGVWKHDRKKSILDLADLVEFCFEQS